MNKFWSRAYVIILFGCFILYSRHASAALYPSSSAFVETWVSLPMGRVYCLSTPQAIEGDNKPTLIFLHGLPDQTLTQIRMLNFLSGQVAIFSCDRLGMGKSEKPQDIDYSIPTQVRQLADIKNQLMRTPVFIFGHSVGGTLAVLYAAQYPDQVAGLILLNPVLKFENGHTGLADWNTHFIRTRGLGEFFMLFHTPSITRAVLKHMTQNKEVVTDDWVQAYHQLLASKGGRQHFLGSLRSLHQMGKDELVAAGSAVAHHKIPTLLLWTDQDKEMPLADQSELAELLGASSHIVKGAGHLPQLEFSDDQLKEQIVLPIGDWIQRNRRVQD